MKQTNSGAGSLISPLLALMPTSVGDYGGLQFRSRPSGANGGSRQWQVIQNYSAGGILDFMASTTATGDPTTQRLSLGANGVNTVYGDWNVRSNLTANLTAVTNGFRLPTNGIPANLIAGRFYSTNGASAVTFGLFDSVPSGEFTKTFVTVSNTTAATPFQVTFPGGTRATNGVPATFDVQGSTEAIFEVYHNAQRSTNVVRVF